MSEPKPGLTREDVDRVLKAVGVGAFAWDVATSTVFWSPELGVLYGRQAGAAPKDFDEYASWLHPADRDAVVETIQTAVASGVVSYGVEHRVTWPDGSVHWIEGRGVIERDAEGRPLRILGTAVDATSRKVTEAALAQRDDALRITAELSNDYIYVVDLTRPGSPPTILSGDFERATGYTPDAIAALGGWDTVIDPEDAAVKDQVYAAIPAGRPYVLEYRIRDANGQVRWLQERGRSELDPTTGKPLRLVGGVREITERKQLEFQLIESQKMEALARLAGGVAHDFNNLLTVLFSGLDVLEDPTANNEADRAEALEALRESTERAAELTRSLLTLARRQPTRVSAVDLGEVLRKARVLIERTLGPKFKLDMRVPESAPCVRIDPSQLQLVLLNLITNARDAMPEGGSVRLALAEVAFKQGDAHKPPELPAGLFAAVSVEDEGCGMPPSVLRQLFEPFFTTKAPGRGVGMGLAMAQGIIGQFRGAISVKSQTGRGTTFAVFLPVCERETTTAHAPPPRFAPGGTERILLVEDEPHVRSQAVRALQTRGYSMTAMGSAEEALNLTADELARVDLLVSDIQLPGLDGSRLAETLRARRPDLRILLVSGYAPESDAFEAIARGAFPFLAKPFTPEGLATRVRELLDAAG